MPRTKNDLLRYGRTFESIEDSQLKPLAPPSHVDKEVDGTLQSIFAPDPVTGQPSSDIHILLSKDKQPEVAQFIRDTLMKPMVGTSLGTDSSSADDALKTVKTASMTRQQYIDNLKSLIEYENN